LERMMGGRRPRLAATTGIGYVSLTITNLEASVRFYHAVIGLHVLKITDTSAVLGTAAEQPLLVLTQGEGQYSSVSNEPGIDHFAILSPDRAGLAQHLGRLMAMDYPIRMISDHGVNESIYVQDPDGIRIELTRDFPPEELAGRRPLGSRDVAFELMELSRKLQPAAGVGAKVRIGHILLRVSELAQSEQFYTQDIGFDVTTRMPGAVFVSAGGYHHHLGFHIWESDGRTKSDKAAIGLRHFSIVNPDYIPPHPLDFHFMRDPSGNGIVLTPHAFIHHEKLLAMDKIILEKEQFH